MRFGFEVYIQEETLGVRLWNWFVKLFYVKPNYDRDMWHSFGFCYSDSALHLRWGKKVKIIWMPWDWGSNIRNEVMTPEGKLVMASDAMEGVARKALRKAGVKGEPLWNLKIPDNRMIETAPYKYTLKNGTVQERVATIHVNEREWRWRIFHPYAIGPKRVSRCISVEFSDEVGERTGSWKGGTIGCGFEMLPGETPLMTLKRMENTRKF